MDITPLIPESVNVIHGYGNGGFTINDSYIEGNSIITPYNIIPWPIEDIQQLEEMDFSWLDDLGEKIEILLIGSGPTHLFIPSPLQNHLQAKHYHPESMDTGAACRTYNILLAEGRHVAAALIAI